MEERIKHIITNQLSGIQLSEQNLSLFKNWLSIEGNQVIYNDLKKIWQTSGNINYSVNVDVNAEWERFIDIRNAKVNNRERKIYFTLSSIAASIILAIGIFIGVNNKTVVYSYSENNNHFVLPDNTEVWLNKNTTLKLAKQFGQEERQVNLQGEAFFEVRKSEKPFRINASHGVSVKVLGTSFNVKSYKNDSGVELQVVSGVVEFGNKDKNKMVVVEKGNEAIYINNENLLLKEAIVNSNKISWHTGELNFNNEPLIAVISMLEQYLSIEIVLPKSASELHYSGKFSNPSVNDVAIVLGKAFGYKYTLTDKKLTFIE